jgi:hypothetical protein
MSGGVMPKTSISSAKISHDFELMVGAAQAPDGTSGTVLKPDVNIELPSFYLFYTNNYPGAADSSYIYGVSYLNGSDELDCTGGNIKSVTYTSLNESLSYYDEAIRQNSKGFKEDEEIECPTPICNFSLPSSMFTNSGDMTGDLIKMWNSGKLDYYKDKYFGGEGNLTDYYVKFSGNNPIIVTISPLAVVPSTDTDDVDFMLQSKSIIVDAYHRYDHIGWGLTDAEYSMLDAYIKLQRPTPMDYTTLPGDTITVTATFTDGTTATKHIVLTFNKDGNLCAKLLDN